MAQELKDTLNLPETGFPMRGNLVSREPERIRHWEEKSLYQGIQDKNAEKPAFILHDGPPFTNGDVHIGTALNKTLKDIILRYKSMRGFRTPYVPGWDCHGLPIEHKVAKEKRQSGDDLDPVNIRKSCAEFSASYIEKQRGQFQRLGVLADWEREYKTMNPAYEAEIIRTFAKFVEDKLVYRSKKPVYWSIPCRTALAEAEIEYQDHKSPSIWVRFQIKEDGLKKLSINNPASIVIWTTTPWTLPANLAVAVHPQLTYIEVNHEGHSYLVVEQLADNFIEACKLEGATKGNKHEGESLEGIESQHPFINRISPIVLAEYVSTDTGTGCVHIAPGHGLDDYLTGLNYNLEIYCPLDDNGCYVEDEYIPKELIGVSVLEKGGNNKANKAVLEILKNNSALLNIETISHQYPHCWRSKTPVIFRAMDQWFVSLDKDDKRKEVLDAIENVKWVPDWGIKRIKGAVESRPDWCISRQRSWGVPIPAFYNEDGTEAYMDSNVIKGLADKVEKDGTDIWFTQTADELLSGIDLPEDWKGPFVKGMDTLDVWIDSGCSHRAVLKKHDDLNWPADLYLEGSDQHRGWFQSSIWTSVITEGTAPYKTILTHGFIVDENKRKISKSDGKPQTADSYVNKYGADIVRLWISSVDYRNDIPLSEKIIKQVVNTYRTIRNTLKFQLGNLCDFDPIANAVPYEELTAIDKWALNKTALLLQNAEKAYDAYEFHRVYQLINNFCNETLSAIYHDILKDRLYTYAPDWKERRSSQTAIYHIFRTLIRVLAPVLTFTSDEAFSFADSDSDFSDSSIHLEEWPEAEQTWLDNSVTDEVDAILAFRSKVNEKLEKARQDKTLGTSMDAKVIVSGDSEDATVKLLEKYSDDLPELFIVSQTELKTEKDAQLDVEIIHAEGEKCPRSWRWVKELVPFENYMVSPRCRDALLARNNQLTET